MRRAWSRSRCSSGASAPSRRYPLANYASAVRILVIEHGWQIVLTGSAAEVTPVAEAGPWNFEVGELTLALRRDYLDLVNRRISNA